jgi:hypothetical protein
MAVHPERLRPQLGIVSGELTKIVGQDCTVIGEEEVESFRSPNELGLLCFR